MYQFRNNYFSDLRWSSDESQDGYQDGYQDWLRWNTLGNHDDSYFIDV